MKEYNKAEYNTMCAEFLGFKLITPSMRRYPDEWKESYWEKRRDDGSKQVIIETRLPFDSDWNWIMKIVEKIEKCGYEVFINGLYCRITDGGQSDMEIESGKCSSQKEAVVQAIWEFLNWYNENK